MDKNTVALTFKRILLLIWKNMILRKRHWVITLFQIILPTLMVLAIAYLNYTATSGLGKRLKREVQTLRENITIKQLLSFTALELAYTTVAYAPSNDVTDQLMNSVVGLMPTSMGRSIELKGFSTEAEIESVVKPQFLKGPSYRNVTTDDISAAIIFKKQFILDPDPYTDPDPYPYPSTDPDPYADPDPYPSTYPDPDPYPYTDPYPFTDITYRPGPQGKPRVFAYTIRLVHDSAKTKELFPRDRPLIEPEFDQYATTGFVGLQLCLDEAIIEYATNSRRNWPLVFKAMPTYGQTSFLGVLPIVFVLSFIFIVPSVVREMVSERESGIKELMRIMGLANWMHLLAWIIDSIIFLSISVTLVTFLLYFKFDSESVAVIAHSSAVLGWVVIFAYCMASVALCILIASFFEQPALAITVGLFVWILSYFGIALIIDRQYDSLNTWLVAFLCVLPNVGISLSLKIIREFETTGVGARWETLFRTASAFQDDSLTLGHILIVMALSTWIYLLLALYVENVFPSTYGVRKPWYYLFKSFYVGKSKISDSQSVEMGGKVNNDDNAGEYFEVDPVGVEPGIQVIHLSKKFGNGKVAVNNLSLNILKGQITALLGHNGAGKTTTMSIITGIVSPTSGTVIIDGHNIRNDVEGARQKMGLCPQHNMLFDKLTVKEHLLFFSKLKQGKSAHTNAEINDMLTQLDMIKKQNVISKSLSGGQKRKLNLAMALVGGSKVVILDEPTSGMDPESRRSVWDVLMSMRANRTILLTTHMMEEADVLGDRIAIMTGGMLKCCGCPAFLKNKYGAGYTLRMTLTGKANANSILTTVCKYVNDASFKGMPNALELAVVLPSLQNSHVFPSLFSDLESNREKLGIKTVGLTLTTMDEIFMRVTLMDQDIQAHSEVPSVRPTSSQLVAQKSQVDSSDTHTAISEHNEQINDASENNLISQSEEQTAISRKANNEATIYPKINKCRAKPA